MIKNIFLLFTISFISFNANAVKPEPVSQDVNVINTPTVTVTNPQTSVTIDNDAVNPIPVTIQGGITVTSEPQFVGFSNDSVQGDVGLVGMHGACSATFGTGARMCFLSEVFKTPNLQPIPSVPGGWIQHDNLYESWPYYNMNCIGWTRSHSSLSGNVLSGERMNFSKNYEITYPGGVHISTEALCDQARPVSCCQ